MKKTPLRSLQRQIVCFLACMFYMQFAPATLFASYTAQYSIQDFETEKKFDQLLLLMQKRLVIMHEVAKTKWNQNLPIEDKVREQQILATLTDQAVQRGLDEKWVVEFFQAQFDAAKEIQKNDFSLWHAQGVHNFEAILSLKDDLRAYIDQINREMIELLSEIHGGIKNKFVLDFPISTRSSDAIEQHVWKIVTTPFIPK